jgi:glutathione S-transferase
MRWTHPHDPPKLSARSQNLLEARMDLYFSPLACSMGTRIALYEAGAAADFFEVETKTKRASDGSAFLEINPLGLVPALRTDQGEIITENAAILQYVADQFPAAQLAPASGLARTRLQQWLCFIGTELHSATFLPLLDPKAPEGAKSYALNKASERLGALAKHLKGREFLLDRFSVADAYLTAVLGWCVVTPIKLAEWPVLADYLARMHARPSIMRALQEEVALYGQKMARLKSV